MYLADNEFGQDGCGNAEAFVQIEDVLRRNGIVFPLTYNDPGEKRSFINGTGAVDTMGELEYFKYERQC